MRHFVGRSGRPSWGRWLTVFIALGLLFAALAYQHEQGAMQQQRVEAAKELATKTPEVALPSDIPSATPAASSAPATPSPAIASSAPAVVPSASAAPEQQPAADLPPTKFIWPAAGMSVDLVPMDWSADEPVDPPLDANGFDPTGHWLKDTGQTDAVKPKVAAGHTCYSPDRRLCNDHTFPFSQLSYPGWAVGQPAAIVDTAGQTIAYSLLDRQIVDKSKAFTFKNDKCLLVLFTCYQDDPLGKITLITFHRNQCT